jgi:limonene-1,2-epoxide hydrolase
MTRFDYRLAVADANRCFVGRPSAKNWRHEGENADGRELAHRQGLHRRLVEAGRGRACRLLQRRWRLSQHPRPACGRPRAAVQAFIAGFVKDWTATEWDILNIVEAGDLVIVERLDRTRVGDKPVDLPCCGVFEMSGGKIKVWRDYFDLTTYTRALGA